LYEFYQKRNSCFSLNNYLERKFNIDEDLGLKVQLLEMPYYINLIFFIGEYSSKNFCSDLKKKIFRDENLREYNDRESIFSNLSCGQNLINKNNISLISNLTEEKKIINNYINNINININNSKGNLIRNEIKKPILIDNKTNLDLINQTNLGESEKRLKFHSNNKKSLEKNTNAFMTESKIKIILKF